MSFSIEPATLAALQSLSIGVQSLAAALNPQPQLDRMEAVLQQLAQGELKAMKTLDDILAETTRQTTIEDGMETLLKGLQAQITAAGGNQAKIDQVFAQYSANNDRAAKALVDNTPAAPPAA